MNFEKAVDKVSEINPYLAFPIVMVWAWRDAAVLLASMVRNNFM